ncbi:hypothetical protein PInf_017140 [Phytophthora infestans]|nr:hypothetical protein PInf_017140 [Phytophthora infestans]
MVEREVFSDEEEERVFDRCLEGGVEEQLVSVPAAVERLERGARVRVSQDPRSEVEQTPGRSDGGVKLRGVATISMSSETDVLCEPYSDQFNETKEDERGRTNADVDIKTEPQMKREVVAGVAARSEGPYTTDGYDGEYYDAQEAYDSGYDAKYEQEEVVKSERNQSWNAQREESGVGGLRGGYGPEMADETPVPTRSSVMSPFPALRTADPFQLLQSVSNAMMVVPVFYLNTATAEKARDFWGLFEAHTGPSRPAQRLKGREAERWWGNSSIRTFSTLKVRFHNQFLRRTADELWERLEITRREKGESGEE